MHARYYYSGTNSERVLKCVRCETTRVFVSFFCIVTVAALVAPAFLNESALVVSQASGRDDMMKLAMSSQVSPVMLTKKSAMEAFASAHSAATLSHTRRMFCSLSS